MAIIVIEEGAANGTDLVLNEARFNPNAIAHTNGQAKAPEPIRVIPLGDDYVMLPEVRIVPAPNADGTGFRFLITVMGGRESAIVGLRLRPVVIGEVGEASLENLRANIELAINPPKEPEPA